DTDGYQLIMKWVAEQSGVAYGSSQDATKAHRVLADHGRGMTFIAAEGVVPSNEGRGYVLRRIVRRAAQHGLRIGMKPPFLPGLADVVIEQMGPAYPELVEHREEIHRGLAAEETRFGETLERGMAIFEEAAAKGEITGEDAFELQTTYGFPRELTEELARERGLAVNEEEYERLMEQHRAVSRQGGAAGRPLSDDGEPHGDPPPPQGAAGGTRRPRPSGRVRRPARQAPVRLHASCAAHARGTRGGGAAGQRAGLREPACAGLRDAAVRGAQPRRDDAVRGEVRRRRARRRRRRLVGRALRRHARAVDCRDRAVRGPLRELGRGRLAADRGGDRRRGV